MPSLGDLVVKIVGDSTGLTKSLDSTQKKLLSFGINAAAVTAAVQKLTKVISDAVQDYTDYGSAIFDASQKTGLSTDAIQEWKYVAEQTGATLESITGAVALMTRGLESNKEIYKSLGIEVKNADGTFKSTTEIFNETIKTLSSMTDETQRDQLAFKLLGRSAQQLIPILNAGTGEIEDLKAEAQDLGIVLKEDTINKAEELGDAFNTLGSTTSSWGRELVNTLQPAILAVTNGITNLLGSYTSMMTATKDMAKALSSTTDINAIARSIQNVDTTLKTLTYTPEIFRTEKQKELIAQYEALKKKLLENLSIASRQAEIRSGATTQAQKETVAQAQLEEAKKRAAEVEQQYADARKTVLSIINTSLTTEQQLIKQLTDLESVRWQKGSKQEADRLAAIEVTKRAIIDAQIAELSSIEESNDQIAKADEELKEKQLKKIEEVKQKNKAAAEQTAKDWQLGFQLMESVTKTVIGEINQGLAQGQLDWKNVGTAAINAIGSIVTALGDQLAAMAAAKTVEAIAALVSGVGAAAAPGLFSSAAVLGGGAVAAWAAGKALETTKLADGGVVQPRPGGVQAIVAEAGVPEAVIPLDRLDQMLDSAGVLSSGDQMTNLVIKLDSRVLYDGIFNATRNGTVLIDARAVVA